ncbi:hypothetical protein ACFL96_00035 [Thermoproteota archaeon]
MIHRTLTFKDIIRKILAFVESEDVSCWAAFESFFMYRSEVPGIEHPVKFPYEQEEDFYVRLSSAIEDYIQRKKEGMPGQKHALKEAQETILRDVPGGDGSMAFSYIVNTTPGYYIRLGERVSDIIRITNSQMTAQRQLIDGETEAAAGLRKKRDVRKALKGQADRERVAQDISDAENRKFNMLDPIPLGKKQVSDVLETQISESLYTVVPDTGYILRLSYNGAGFHDFCVKIVTDENKTDPYNRRIPLKTYYLYSDKLADSPLELNGALEWKLGLNQFSDRLMQSFQERIPDFKREDVCLTVKWYSEKPVRRRRSSSGAAGGQEVPDAYETFYLKVQNITNRKDLEAVIREGLGMDPPLFRTLEEIIAYFGLVSRKNIKVAGLVGKKGFRFQVRRMFENQQRKGKAMVYGPEWRPDESDFQYGLYRDFGLRLLSGDTFNLHKLCEAVLRVSKMNMITHAGRLFLQAARKEMLIQYDNSSRYLSLETLIAFVITLQGVPRLTPEEAKCWMDAKAGMFEYRRPENGRSKKGAEYSVDPDSILTIIEEVMRGGADSGDEGVTVMNGPDSGDLPVAESVSAAGDLRDFNLVLDPGSQQSTAEAALELSAAEESVVGGILKPGEDGSEQPDLGTFAAGVGKKAALTECDPETALSISSRETEKRRLLLLFQIYRGVINKKKQPDMDLDIDALFKDLDDFMELLISRVKADDKAYIEILGQSTFLYLLNRIVFDLVDIVKLASEHPEVFNGSRDKMLACISYDIINCFRREQTFVIQLEEIEKEASVNGRIRSLDRLRLYFEQNVKGRVEYLAGKMEFTYGHDPENDYRENFKALIEHYEARLDSLKHIEALAEQEPEALAEVKTEKANKEPVEEELDEISVDRERERLAENVERPEAALETRPEAALGTAPDAEIGMTTLGVRSRLVYVIDAAVLTQVEKQMESISQSHLSEAELAGKCVELYKQLEEGLKNLDQEALIRYNALLEKVQNSFLYYTDWRVGKIEECEELVLVEVKEQLKTFDLQNARVSQFKNAVYTELRRRAPRTGSYNVMDPQVLYRYLCFWKDELDIREKTEIFLAFLSNLNLEDTSISEYLKAAGQAVETTVMEMPENTDEEKKQKQVAMRMFERAVGNSFYGNFNRWNRIQFEFLSDWLSSRVFYDTQIKGSFQADINHALKELDTPSLKTCISKMEKAQVIRFLESMDIEQAGIEDLFSSLLRLEKIGKKAQEGTAAADPQELGAQLLIACALNRLKSQVTDLNNIRGYSLDFIVSLFKYLLRTDLYFSNSDIVLLKAFLKAKISGQDKASIGIEKQCDAEMVYVRLKHMLRVRKEADLQREVEPDSLFSIEKRMEDWDVKPDGRVRFIALNLFEVSAALMKEIHQSEMVAFCRKERGFYPNLEALNTFLSRLKTWVVRFIYMKDKDGLIFRDKAEMSKRYAELVYVMDKLTKMGDYNVSKAIYAILTDKLVTDLNLGSAETRLIMSNYHSLFGKNTAIQRAMQNDIKTRAAGLIYCVDMGTAFIADNDENNSGRLSTCFREEVLDDVLDIFARCQYTLRILPLDVNNCGLFEEVTRCDSFEAVKAQMSEWPQQAAAARGQGVGQRGRRG